MFYWSLLFLPLELSSFLCASNRLRFCVPSRTAMSSASTLLLKYGLRPRTPPDDDGSRSFTSAIWEERF